MTDLLDYENHHATVLDAIRYGVSGVQSPVGAATEALVRLRSGARPLDVPRNLNEDELHVVIAAAVERGAKNQLPLADAAHAALDDLRSLGVPIGPRPPDDPFPES